MLVLSATYMSSLSKLVAEHDLERILKRTIGFLVQNGNISPTIRADARMLTEIYQKIFHRAPDLNNYTLRMNHQWISVQNPTFLPFSLCIGLGYILSGSTKIVDMVELERMRSRKERAAQIGG